MSSDVEIHGFCDDRFLRVRDAFADNFRQSLEVGASLAITVDGEYAVDLWGGSKSSSTEDEWGRDTIVVVFSTSKIIITLCALMLVDRGELNLDAPVARYWPEFAQSGKEKLPVRYIFSHSAGLPGFDEVFPFEVLYDWERIVKALARQEPWWEPGSASGYQHIAHGFLLGELVRRISGISIGAFFRTEVAEKIGADFHIGLPEEHHARVAELVWSKLKRESPRDSDPDSVAARIWASPAWPTDPTAWISRDFMTAEIPSVNGHGNARSVARVGSILAMGGQLDGTCFLSSVHPQIANFCVARGDWAQPGSLS